MISRKEKRKDTATLATVMKDIMNEPSEHPLISLHQELAFYVTNRVAMMIKHNNYQPVCSLGEIGEILATIAADMVQDGYDAQLFDKSLEQVNEEVLKEMTDAYTTRVKQWDAQNTDSLEFSEAVNVVTDDAIIADTVDADAA